MKDKQGEAPVFGKFSATKKDYFIPIKIVKAAPGSKIKNNTDPVMISVRNVAVIKDGQNVEMKTTVATDVLGDKIREIETEERKKTNAALEAKKAQTRHLQTLEAATAHKTEIDCKTCHEDGPVTKIAKMAEHIQSQSVPQHLRPPTPADASTAQKEYDQMSENFERTCHMNLDNFTKVIAEKVKGTLFRPEHLLAIMWKESKGECFPISKTGIAEKHGLFGIQDANWTIKEKVCSKSQAAALHKTVASNPDAWQKFSDYKSNPELNCVGNPFLNLEAAIRILGVKKDMIKGTITTDIVDGEPKLNMQSLFPVLFNYNGNRKQAYKTVQSSKRAKPKKVALGESVQREYARSGVARVGAFINAKTLLDVLESTPAPSSLASDRE